MTEEELDAHFQRIGQMAITVVGDEILKIDASPKEKIHLYREIFLKLAGSVIRADAEASAMRRIGKGIPV